MRGSRLGRTLGVDAATAASYAHCARVSREQARNFYNGFRLLPAAKRAALCAVYACLRRGDDIVDCAGAGDCAVRLREWRSQMDAALGPNPPTLSELEWPALRHAVHRYSVPHELFHAVFDGAEMDLATCEFATFADLRVYCYRVASAVGLVCLHVWGTSDMVSAAPMADACGCAFQLTNILRDLREDAAAGRLYLPSEDLARFAYTRHDLERHVCDDRFRALMRFEAGRALELFAAAEPLAELIEPDSRACFLAMFGTYRALLDAILARDCDVFGKRVSVAAPQKARVVLGALWRARAMAR